MASVVVIYSISQGRVRRLIIPDDDAQLVNLSSSMLPGEAVLTYDKKLGTDEASAQAQVNNITGRKPADDLCAVVGRKSGAVLAIIKADPSIDLHPDGDVVAAFDGVSVGCSYDSVAKTFTRPAYELPAGVNRSSGLPILKQTILAEVLVKPIDPVISVDPVIPVDELNP